MTEGPTPHRGTKRKRPPYMPDEDPMAKLPKKLHHALREVKKSLKKARTFETQKLVKKFKTLRKSDKNSSSTADIADLEKQLESIKHIDLDDVATAVLRNKLKKDHVLSSHSIVQNFMDQELVVSRAEIGATSVEGKVRNKLTSSKAFSSDIAASIHGLRTILIPGEQSVSEDNEDGTRSESRSSKQRRSNHHTNHEKEENNSEEEEEDDDDDDDEKEPVGLKATTTNAGTSRKSGSVSPHFKPEADGWESGSIDGESDKDNAIEDDDDEDDDLEGGSSGSDSHIPINRPPNNSSKHVSSSTFLPSLSVGFIPGGSDSDDFSDGEAKSADGAKKNRRGQRARRAIWEKKYGRGAKHLQKQRDLEKQKQIFDKDKRRGGTSKPEDEGRSNTRSRPPKFQPPIARDSGYGSRTTAVSAEHRPTIERTQREYKPLHPSWEAKKKLQERQKPVILPPQGKKIVF